VELPLMYNAAIGAKEREERAVKALQAVGLGERLYHKSNQMSGGQMQRVAIARALVNDPAVILADEATGNLDTRTSFEILILFQKLHAAGRTIIFVTHNPAIALSCDPDLLICDEPTTALDVTIQAKILELIRSIQKERGISVIYITHDLGVVAKVADYVDVMYAGKIVETGTIDEIFYDPRHPYTWGLLSAMPDLDTADERLYTIPGSPPNLLHEKAGDAFAPRNKYALEIDDEIDPPMFKISDTHFAATWLLDPRAPKVEMPPELKDRVARMSAEAKKIEEAE
jgi:oligopeptide/dipeptide ABC transporter ATP-binding protein